MATTNTVMVDGREIVPLSPEDGGQLTMESEYFDGSLERVPPIYLKKAGIAPKGTPSNKPTEEETRGGYKLDALVKSLEADGFKFSGVDEAIPEAMEMTFAKNGKSVTMQIATRGEDENPDVTKVGGVSVDGGETMQLDNPRGTPAEIIAEINELISLADG